MTEPGEPRLNGRRLEELAEQSQHAQRRYGLYKARTYGPRPSSPARLGELRRDAERASERLNRAKSNV
jgi:hypothetical protein